MTPLAAFAISTSTGLEEVTCPTTFSLAPSAGATRGRPASGEAASQAFALLRGLAFLGRLATTMTPCSGGSVTRPVRNTVLVVTLLHSAPDVAGKHCVQCLIAFVFMTFREAVIRRDVEREGFNLAQVLVKQGLKDLLLVRPVRQPQERGIPFILEFGQAAIGVEMHRPEVVDVVNRRVLGVLRVPIIDQAKYHTTSEDPTGVRLSG
jgi:hypothetical protein